MFYDPPSRRIKAAAILSPGKGGYFYSFFYHQWPAHWQGKLYHPWRLYQQEKRCEIMDEIEPIHSKEGEIIGLGALGLGFRYKPQPIWFRSACNARNAVVGGERNDLNPDRDAYAELCATGDDYGTYWYLTETWEEYKERVQGSVDDYPNGGNCLPDAPYVWMGFLEDGRPDGDCIIQFENWEGKPLVGFDPATENIPQCIDARAFRPPPPETS
ncbi:MAG: hypothetical protein M2R45_04186 [Verrucomicrobia subdivision 3 bacterium]|nr:hypothetical protein [Limisphaerales bacterium]MCS1413009.1 hypothetical protein [Limisphaerales bacterium]